MMGIRRLRLTHMQRNEYFSWPRANVAFQSPILPHSYQYVASSFSPVISASCI